ncbi:MAG: TrmH family RNA methyltransferase [Flavobacteriaceae bacterium]
MNQSQLTHKEVNNKENTKEIVVITNNIRTPENVGMLFRISEAFGVKRIFLIGETPNLNNKKVLRTARSTEKMLDITFVETAAKLITDLRTDNFQLIGLELAQNSVSITDFNFLNQSKIALFVGAERFGIDAQILDNLDACVHINMFGKNSSVNVVNALAIALFEINRG